MDWLLLSFLTALVWGLNIAFAKRAYKQLSPIDYVSLRGVASVITLIPFSLLQGGKFIFWPLVPAAAIASGGYALYYYALEKGKLSLTGTVLETYPLYTVILASLFLNESITATAKFGIFAILLGLIFISLEHPKEIKNIKIGTWLLWGLGGAVFAGLGDFIAKVMSSEYGAYSYSISFVLGWTIVAVILNLLSSRKFILPRKISPETSYAIASSFFSVYWSFIFSSCFTKRSSINSYSNFS
ncbi:EamA family transporter [Candidatus Daviesbacteria bacterium]|nr:EamA family transporter [Candidatus Daviesbacteria bacterium]